MIAILRLTALRHLRQKPSRFVLTALGVACGVALYVAIALINRATLASFRESVESLAGKSTHTVFGDESGFPEEVLEAVTKVPGVQSAVPMIETRAWFTDSSGRSRSLAILGVDLLSETAVRSYKNGDQQVMDDPLIFLNQPDSLIVTTALARDEHLGIDSKLALSTAWGTKTFTVRGILSPDGPAKAYGGTLAIMDIDGARVTFGKEGKIDRIDLVPKKGEDGDLLAQRVAAALGKGYRVERPETQAAGLGRMIEGYQALLSLMSYLALFVGVFIVANAVGIAVAERRREIGTLRALGAGRPTVVWPFVAESLLTGLCGSVLGLVAGRLLAAVLVKSIARALSAQFLRPMQISALRLQPRDVVLSFAVGAVVSLIAALVPSIRAARVHPLEALRPQQSGDPGKRARHARLLRVSGLAMLALLVVSSRLDLSARLAAFEVIDPIFAVAGALLASPGVVSGLLSLLNRLVPRLAPGSTATVTRIAFDNLLRNPRRTGSNVMSLVIGLMLVIVMATTLASVRSSMSDWFSRTLRFDIMVSGAGNLASVQVQPLHESLAAEIAKVPGLVQHADGRRVAAMRFSHVAYQGHQIGLKAFDGPFNQDSYSVFDVVDRPAAEAGRELFESVEPAAMVSQNFVMRFGHKTGDTLDLDAPGGTTRFRIVAVVNDYASPEGVVYLSRDLYKKLWRDPLVTGFGAMVAPGTPVEDVKREIDARFGKARGLQVTSTAELRAQAERVIDEAFASTRAIELAALLVGLLGLLNTLLVSVLERTREFGMLRAVGMSRAQLAGMVFCEALAQGALGALAAAALGAFVSWAWLVGGFSRMLGWVIAFRFPWTAVGTALLFGVLVGAIAGWLPARRAARLEIREALDHE